MEHPYLQVDMLGDIRIEDIYVYYDEPLTFSCRNTANHLYVANCIKITDEFIQYLFLPISREKLRLAETDKLTAREIFTYPEEKQIWMVTADYEEDIAHATLYHPSALTDDMLPGEGVHLNDLRGQLNEYNELDLIETSISEKREILDISFEYRDGHQEEISVVALSKSLKRVQDLINALAHPQAHVTSQYKRKVLEANQLNAALPYAGSFGMRLKSNDLSDIYGESEMTPQIQKMFDLFNASSSPQKLQIMLTEYGLLSGLKFRDLLYELQAHELGFKADYASPTKKRYKATMSTKDIASSLQIIDSSLNNTEKTYTVSGRLVAVNTKNSTFIFIPHDLEKYSEIEGKYDETLNVDTFKLPTEVEINITEIYTINEITHKEKTHYHLNSIDYHQN